MKWPSIDLMELRLALRNVSRQRARSALTLSVIATGVAGLILSGGFVEDSLRTLRESTIHAQLGHLQVYRQGFVEHGRNKPFDYLIERPDETRRTIAALPQVVNVLSRLGFAGVLNNGHSDFAIIGEGVEPAAEAKLGTQIRMVEGRPLEAGDHYGMMVGEGVAAGAGIHVGSVVTLLLNTQQGALNNLEFTVVGTFRTFSKDYDARAVRVALPDAQELVASPAINAIVVELKDTASTDEVADALRQKLDPAVFEVKTWLQLADFYEKTAALFTRQFSFLQAIILLSVLLAVANSVNMTVFERTGEFGTLMALGTRRLPIFRLVIVENLIVGLAGGLLGVALGIVAAAVINAMQIEMPPPPNSNSGYYAGVRLAAIPILSSFLVGLLATPLTALWPAFRISRVPVVDALRAN